MSIKETKPELRVKLLEYRGLDDVMCLHAICQPVVSQMQNCIRFQNEQLQGCAAALHHVLKRIKVDEKVQYKLGAGTESFELLTAALADCTNRDVDAVRDYYIPGSAALHRDQKEEE